MKISDFGTISIWKWYPFKHYLKENLSGLSTVDNFVINFKDATCAFVSSSVPRLLFENNYD